MRRISCGFLGRIFVIGIWTAGGSASCSDSLGGSLGAIATFGTAKASDFVLSTVLLLSCCGFPPAR